jgi:hypothetical protein
VTGNSALAFTTRGCLMPCAESWVDESSVVDIFNVATGFLYTSVLSRFRHLLAATSLPNAGVAIFAGGASTSYYVYSRCCNMGVGVRGMCEWVECGCVYDASLSHALCSWRWSSTICGHLPRGDWNLEHSRTQPGSMLSCSRVAAGCRSRDICWRRNFL